VQPQRFFGQVFRGVRAAILIAISIFLLCIAIAMVLKGQVVDGPSVVENEHRFTSLEVRLDTIQNDIKDLRQYNWIIYTALAGLAGEAGLRIIKGKPKEED